VVDMTSVEVLYCWGSNFGILELKLSMWGGTARDIWKETHYVEEKTVMTFGINNKVITYRVVQNRFWNKSISCSIKYTNVYSRQTFVVKELLAS